MQLFEPLAATQLADLEKVMEIERRSDGALFLVEGTLPFVKGIEEAVLSSGG